MALDIKHPPEDWQDITGVFIIDRDGWPMGTWEQPITREEFLTKAAASTARYPRGFFGQFK